MIMEQTGLINVLLVEDNEDDAFFISEALGEQFKVNIIQDGEKAYNYLLTTKLPPDVILMDYKLPSMNGLEIIKALNSENKELIYIVLTVDMQIETAIESMKAGALDFLPKSKGYDFLPDMILKAYRIRQDREEKKQMQKELLKSKKHEAISILAGGIAHDFNNLLYVILGNITLAKDELEKYKALEFLDKAEKAVLQTRELIQQLLSFAQRNLSEKRMGSMEDVVKIAVESFSWNLKIKWNIISSNPCLVELDKKQMIYAVQKLLENAVESMPDDGEISIMLENTTIAHDIFKSNVKIKKGKYLKLSIKDQGIGIPEENFSKIFDPYFSTKERGIIKGMGMGLAVVYSIIKRHNGYITVASTIDKGTNFNIYLPA